MAVSVNKVDGVTVYTMASDPRNPYPPLCQILFGFCCNPLCCAVSATLRKIQGGSQYILGTVHIMVGILNIVLGVKLFTCSSPYPFWLGGMFVLFGTVAILSEKLPSPCMIILNVILNLFGVLFAIAAIVLYSLDLAIVDINWICDQEYNWNRGWQLLHRRKKECLQLVWLVRKVMVLLIVLAALELLVSISCAVLGIKTLKKSEKTGNKESPAKASKSAQHLFIVED